MVALTPVVGEPSHDSMTMSYCDRLASLLQRAVGLDSEAGLAVGCSRAAFAARLHRARARVRAAIDAPQLERYRTETQHRQLPNANSIEEAI